MEIAQDIVGKVFSEYGLALTVLVAVSSFLGYRLWQRDKFVQTELIRLMGRYEETTKELIRQQEKTAGAINLLRETLRR